MNPGSGDPEMCACKQAPLAFQELYIAPHMAPGSLLITNAGALILGTLPQGSPFMILTVVDDVSVFCPPSVPWRGCLL